MSSHFLAKSAALKSPESESGSRGVSMTPPAAPSPPPGGSAPPPPPTLGARAAGRSGGSGAALGGGPARGWGRGGAKRKE